MIKKKMKFVQFVQQLKKKKKKGFSKMAVLIAERESLL